MKKLLISILCSIYKAIRRKFEYIARYFFLKEDKFV